MWARLSSDPADSAGAEVLAVPVYSGAAGPVLAAPLPGGLASAIGAGVAGLRQFNGAVGQVAVVPVTMEPTLVVAVGVGDASECPAERLRPAAAALGAYVRRYDRVVTSLAQASTDDLAVAVRTVVEGFGWGRFAYREASEGAGADLTVLVGAGADSMSETLQRALAEAIQATTAVTWVRRMVETPPSQLPPAVFAERIQARAADAGVECRVWSADQLHSEGFGATLGVGAGSVNPPVVAELRYAGDGISPTWGLAGKGITFDSGGINLKRDADEISWMKSDMAGAASVVAAVCAAASLHGPRPVHALVPLAENLLGPGAVLPGDVVRHPDGTTTEVLDTDNEGRLVLADAVAYLAAQRVAAVIDVGTLTDGGAIGHLLWGCWGTAPELISDLLTAGAGVGDPGWQLPLRAEYRALFDSPVADRTNRARDVPDTGTTAATFLSTFAGTVPWVHIDNGSTAYLDADLPPWGPGATGSPTLALLELLLRGT